MSENTDLYVILKFERYLHFSNCNAKHFALEVVLSKIDKEETNCKTFYKKARVYVFSFWLLIFPILFLHTVFEEKPAWLFPLQYVLLQFVFALTLKAPSKTCNRQTSKFLYIFYILEKISIDISCESSAWQMIHMKCQDSFSLKNKKNE